MDYPNYRTHIIPDTFINKLLHVIKLPDDQVAFCFSTHSFVVELLSVVWNSSRNEFVSVSTNLIEPYRGPDANIIHEEIDKEISQRFDEIKNEIIDVIAKNEYYSLYALFMQE